MGIGFQVAWWVDVGVGCSKTALASAKAAAEMEGIKERVRRQIKRRCRNWWETRLLDPQRGEGVWSAMRWETSIEL